MNLNTIFLSLYQNISDIHFINDVIEVMHIIYGNAPSIKSRIISTNSNAIMKTFVFFSNPLAQDGNPTASNVIREMPGLVTTALNAYQKHPITTNTPDEVQDAMHVLGQSFRLTCKLSFQALPFENKVFASRVSNVLCDSLGVSGTDLSRQSQREGKSLYYFYPDKESNSTNSTKEQYSAWKYINEKVDLNYTYRTIPKAVFKSLVLDQVGEVIKLTKSMSLTTSLANSVNNIFYSSLSSALHLENTLSSSEDFYTTKNKIFNSKLNVIGYSAVAAVGVYKTLYISLPDVLIEGTIMLSASNSAVNYMTGLPFNQMGTALALATSTAYFKNYLISAISSVTPVLAVASTLMLYNPIYDKVKEFVQESFLNIEDFPPIGQESYILNDSDN